MNTRRFLHIGCGLFPKGERGWENLDIRDLPGVQHVQDACDLSNFPDDTFHTVFAKDVIEHLSWRDVERAVAEWVRVTKREGTIVIETPNAVQALEILIDPESPRGTRSGDESEWTYFCRVLFGHQDYPENTHRCYFTPRWLTEILLAAGADRVLRQEAVSPWSFRLEAHK